ncbi:MAG: response regulator [Methanomicrobiales archaeon]
MNNSLSDGNENVIDIFIFGDGKAGTLELIKQLELQGYRVTHFTEGQELIDALRSGRPNLIICDTTTYGQVAYDYCRQIKSDEALWSIPVMILTCVTSLSDLLNVLDSNGDNFIAHPYDLPYLLSLIEGMLSTPAERLTSDQIKTHFKIQHDGKIFVATADRRKLLEFLLSAFEIAVKNSEELLSTQNELGALSSRLTTLEDTGIDNARVIGLLNANLKKKEQDESALKGGLEETEQALDEKTAEVGQLSCALGESKTHLAAAEEHVRMLLAEKEKTAACNLSETTLMNDQLTALSQEIGLKTALLNSTHQAQESEKIHAAVLELAAKESAERVDQLQSSLQVLTLEHETLKIAFTSEKNRAKSAELETKAVLLVKTQLEEELTRLFDEMKDSAQKQHDANHLVKTALEEERVRRTEAEARSETLRLAAEESTAARQVREESDTKLINELQSRLNASVGTIFTQERDLKMLRDERIVARAEEIKAAAAAASVTAALNKARSEIEESEWKVQSLQKQISNICSQKGMDDEKIHELTALLETAQSAFALEKEQYAVVEERLKAILRERDETLEFVQGSHDQVKTDLEWYKNNLAQLNCDLEAAVLLRATLQGDIASASSRIKELVHELATAMQAKNQAVEQVRALAEEREQIKAGFNEARQALVGEKESRAALQDQLNAAIRAKDETLKSIIGEHDQTKTDLAEYKNNLLHMNRDLEAASRISATLLADFKAASSRIEELERELKSVVSVKEQVGQQVRSLYEDLERTKAELETERRIRRTVEMNLETAAQVTSRSEGDIARSAAEREAIHAALEHERIQHMATAEQARAATLAREQAERGLNQIKEAHKQHDVQLAEQIQTFNHDFERMLARQRELEQQVQILEHGKAAAEARANALTLEIEQARTTLADEWEDHMNDQERLEVIERKAIQLEQSLAVTGKAANELERKLAVVIKQTDLPAEINVTPKAVVIPNTPAKREEPEPPVISETRQEFQPSSVTDDLCEDVSPVPDATDGSIRAFGSQTAGFAAENPGVIMGENPGNEPWLDVQEHSGPEGEEESDEEIEEEKGVGEGDPQKQLDNFMITPSGYGISFNRLQWFDLLRWSHYSGALSQEQRMQIVRMGRLIQNGRKRTKKQNEQVREIIVLVQTLGYRFH